MTYEPKSRDEKFLTVNEVAELLKVTPYTVRSMIKRGQLRAMRLGNYAKAGYRISLGEVDHFLQPAVRSEKNLDFKP